MGEAVIREATDADAVRAFLDREWSKLDPEPWRETRFSLVAERDGEIIGAAVAHITAGVAHLSELMVRDGERNSGLGARLLAAFETWAVAQGAHLGTLNTHTAQPFYERHGWRVAWIAENYYQHHTTVWMTKALATGDRATSV